MTPHKDDEVSENDTANQSDESGAPKERRSSLSPQHKGILAINRFPVTALQLVPTPCFPLPPCQHFDYDHPPGGKSGRFLNERGDNHQHHHHHFPPYQYRPHGPQMYAHHYFTSYPPPHHHHHHYHGNHFDSPYHYEQHHYSRSHVHYENSMYKTHVPSRTNDLQPSHTSVGVCLSAPVGRGEMLVKTYCNNASNDHSHRVTMSKSQMKVAQSHPYAFWCPEDNEDVYIGDGSDDNETPTIDGGDSDHVGLLEAIHRRFYRGGTGTLSLSPTASTSSLGPIANASEFILLHSRPKRELQCNFSNNRGQRVDLSHPVFRFSKAALAMSVLESSSSFATPAGSQHIDHHNNLYFFGQTMKHTIPELVTDEYFLVSYRDYSDWAQQQFPREVRQTIAIPNPNYNYAASSQKNHHGSREGQLNRKPFRISNYKLVTVYRHEYRRREKEKLTKLKQKREEELQKQLDEINAKMIRQKRQVQTNCKKYEAASAQSTNHHSSGATTSTGQFLWSAARNFLVNSSPLFTTLSIENDISYGQRHSSHPYEPLKNVIYDNSANEPKAPTSSVTAGKKTQNVDENVMIPFLLPDRTDSAYGDLSLLTDIPTDLPALIQQSIEFNHSTGGTHALAIKNETSSRLMLTESTHRESLSPQNVPASNALVPRQPVHHITQHQLVAEHSFLRFFSIDNQRNRFVERWFAIRVGQGPGVIIPITQSQFIQGWEMIMHKEVEGGYNAGTGSLGSFDSTNENPSSSANSNRATYLNTKRYSLSAEGFRSLGPLPAYGHYYRRRHAYSEGSANESESELSSNDVDDEQGDIALPALHARRPREDEHGKKKLPRTEVGTGKKLRHPSAVFSAGRVVEHKPKKDKRGRGGGSDFNLKPSKSQKHHESQFQSPQQEQSESTSDDESDSSSQTDSESCASDRSYKHRNREPKRQQPKSSFLDYFFGESHKDVVEVRGRGKKKSRNKKKNEPLNMEALLRLPPAPWPWDWRPSAIHRRWVRWSRRKYHEIGLVAGQGVVTACAAGAIYFFFFYRGGQRQVTSPSSAHYSHNLHSQMPASTPHSFSQPSFDGVPHSHLAQHHRATDDSTAAERLFTAASAVPKGILKVLAVGMGI